MSKRVLLAGLTTSLLAATFPARSQEIAPAPDAAPPVAPEASADVTKVGGQPTFEARGFVELDAIYDFKRVNPAWNAMLRPDTIPTTPGTYGEDGEFILSPRRTRFGFQAAYPLGAHELKSKVEVDFFGRGTGRPDAIGQNTIRLFNAFAEWGPVFVGHTLTNFADADYGANYLDIWGPPGIIFLRSPSVRYSLLEGTHTLTVALERPGADFDGTGGPTGAAPQDLLPDASLRYRLSGDWGHLHVAGLVRRLGYDTPGAPEQTTEHVFGYGGTVSATINVLRGVLAVSPAALAGRGIGNYVNGAGSDIAFQEQTDAAAALRALPVYGATLYADVNWTQSLSSSVGVSWVQTKNSTLQAPGAFESAKYLSANLVYTPARIFFVGPEFQWAERNDENGASGTDYRVFLAARFSFSSLDAVASR
jgi:hypothetical protein